MNNKYVKRLALAAGMLAVAGTGAYADGVWQNINSQLKNPAFIPGWSGALAATGDGVAEVWCGAFELYQVLNDMPAGEYTLTANAFYRNADNEKSKEDMKDGKNHNAYIFLGTAEQAVEGLFDNNAEAPNSTGEAAAAFAAGKYLNTVKFNHPGGDLKLGIKDLGGYYNEWTCFDNFKLTGPEGDVAIVNCDFSEDLNVDKNQTVWNCINIDNSAKGPDANKLGGVYRKTNASPYNLGQDVELPAGKYRFGVQSFMRYGGAGNLNGKYITCKGDWAMVEGESPLDRHQNGTEAEADNAYIYVTNGWDTNDDGSKTKPVSEEFALDPEFGNKDGFYTQIKIKCIYDEKMDVYPDNETAEYTSWDQETNPGVNADGYHWEDSGFEYQAAKYFINNPDKYRNYVEFELTEPQTVWVGIKKDSKTPAEYWNPFRDFTLEKWVETQEGGIAGIAADNAPAVYYNLQGIRVNNPENGFFIVKKGNKTQKVLVK